MDDRPSFSPVSDKKHARFGRETPDATTPHRKFFQQTAHSAVEPSRFSLPALAGSRGETRQNKGDQK
jgi:hypothetical protein